ncbi:MAG: SAM-dependent methyltransferase [Hydrogenophilus sp.]|nr:SAM-dependent methyltransferase [Hydrogenophilus sp.]
MKEPMEVTAAEAERSAELGRRIAARIAAAGGWVPFADFMGWALYEPGLGYYATHDRPFGVEGDFVTAPEISPLFGAVLADRLAACVARTRTAVEFGAGSGALAADLLRRWAELGCLPRLYAIVEVSAGLAARQQARLEPLARELGVMLEWWEELPGEGIAATVVTNEVLDALPVHVVATMGEETVEQGVVVRGPDGGVGDGPQFDWEDRPLTAAAAAAVAEIALPRTEGERYVTEVSPAVRAWVRGVAERLRPGSCWVVADYGYPRPALYAPFRSRGTLLGYRRHRVVEEVLWGPGLVDLTAFVDFTGVVTAMEAGGLRVVEWRRQGEFLLQHGVLERLRERAEVGSRAYLQAARAVNRLIAPHEMGDLCMVVVGERC